MTAQEMKQLKVMKYNELKPSESDNQKKKFQKMLREGKYIASLKRDGAFYRFIKEENGNKLLQGRTISRKTGEHTEKQDRVPHIIEALDVLPAETVLIGEICYPKGMGKTSSDITSIMGCLAPKAISRQEDQKLHYMIFDLLMYDGLDYSSMPYEKRIKKLQKVFEESSFPKFIEPPELIEEDIEEKISEWLDEGEEGGVLMKKDEPYHFDKRPKWVSVKIKQSLKQDIDLVVIGFSDPNKDYTGKYITSWEFWENTRTGELVKGFHANDAGYRPVSSNYYYGYIGGLVLGLYKDNGDLIQVAKTANLTDELRIDITKNPSKYMNRVVKVNAMSVDYERKSLRHPKFIDFHDGKDASDCLYKDVF